MCSWRRPWRPAPAAPGSSPTPGRPRSRRRRWRARSRSRRWRAPPAISFTCRRRDRWIRCGWRAGAGSEGVFAEVCTHHLLLDDTRYAGADAERYLVCPPLRDRGHVEALWEGLADGTIDTVGSDHCQVKSATTGTLAEDGQHYSYGLAGVGPRLPLLLSAAAARGLPIERVAPARGGEPGARLRALPGEGCARAGIRRRHRDLRPRGRGRPAGRRVRRRHRRQRLRGPGRPRPDPGGAAARRS